MLKDNPGPTLPITHPPRQSYQGLLHIIGLAVAYVIAGKLSYFSVIPPGYAAAIWPPAGVALAAMLVYGYRVWPGVMLGALIVNGLIPEMTGSIAGNLLSALITLGISTGATLQALSGAYLVKRFAGYPNGLIRAKDIFRFWLAGGLLSALINSTLSVALLVAVGTTPAANFPANWATWWLGDALGIMLFTPLTLVWLCQTDSAWCNRKWLITLPIVVMFMLTLSAAYYENQNSRQRLMLTLDQEAQAFKVALENELSININALRALGSFYKASNAVTRAEFKTFTTDALKQLPGINALGWNAAISGTQRDTYEATIKSEGYPNFEITQQDANQQLLTAENRPEYVPVTFIEPYQGNEKVLGFDIYSNAIRREAVERARASGEITLTARIMLVQEQSRGYGVLAIMPVYAQGRAHQSLEERRQHVTGYLVAVFKIEAIIAATLKASPAAGLSYRLVDQSAPAAEQLLFVNDQTQPSARVVKTKSFFNNPKDLLSATKIAIGGRIWRLEITFTPDYIAQHGSDSAWLLLLSGLLLTCLVSAFALMASGQGRLLQLQVIQRTAALQASKRRFDSTFNDAPFAIAHLSPQGGCLEINQYFCEFMGYSHAEALTIPCLQLMHPDHHQLNNEKIAQCLSGEISGFTLDNQYQHKLGHLLWGKLTVKLIRTEAGRPDYLIKIIEDITARKAVEQALDKADILKNAIVNSSTFASIATDAKGVIQIFNLGAENMLGYQADEVLNQLTPADFSDHQELLTRAMTLSEEQSAFITPGFEALGYKASRGIEDIYELTYIRKNGSRFPAMVSITALRSSSIIIGYLLIAIDNTVKKQAEETIRRLSLAVEQSPNSVTITDLNGTIEYVNAAFVKTSGYHADELIGKHQKIIASGKTPEAVYNDMRGTLNRGDAWQGEFINKSKAGVEYIELTWISPIRQPDGTVTHYLGLKEDITERKHNEAIIVLAKERAEALAKSKSQFLANMSHEIRTPMNAIIGLSQLALNKNFSPEAVDYLDKINRASTSLLIILNDILDLSRLEVGRVAIEYKHFHLDGLLDTLHNLFDAAAKEKNLAFTIVLAGDVPLGLIGDASRLQQVLINLLGNAIKFTAHGSVTLTIMLQQIDQSQARLLFSVADTGIGLSSQDQEKLFKPFSQVDDSITRRFGGSGLGLAISNNLLQLMGSRFTLDSTPGRGSCFSFELVMAVLPLTRPYKLESPTGRLASTLSDFSQLLTGSRILVAEDNHLNQQVVSEFLELSGISVKIANNGQEALTLLLEQGEFDAVLMDMHMPVMDGFEATRQIRNQLRFVTLPVLALSAGVTQEEQEECLASGINDFISKPINPVKLLSTLAQWIKPDNTKIESLEEEAVAVPAIDTLPDFDQRNLLLMLGNNQELATQLLFNFKDNMQNLPAELAELIASGSLVIAKEKIHTLKGVAGNFGAVRLHAAAEILEAELKSELPTTAAVNHFTAAFNQTMSVIAAQSPPDIVLPFNAGNRDELLLSIAELDALIQEQDFIPEELLNTLKTHLATEQLELFIRLRKLIHDLDYKNVRLLLQQLILQPGSKDAL
ncbi:PAS domain S-box protein [Methylobacter psychrophilus]|uniref:PAS domain S-box protein n=1 Tax=Methylobacter psychrophilus TaxID=96941 RepID=UPI0021D4EC63|nr:PAS domain S-box protein [Methylobacter psychrophilus]